MADSPKKTVSRKYTKYYTFNLCVSFDMQFTFTESEVEPDAEGDEGDFEPTDRALHAVEQELTEHLGQNYPVANLEVYGDSDSLLGIAIEPKEPSSASTLTTGSAKASAKVKEEISSGPPHRRPAKRKREVPDAPRKHSHQRRQAGLD